MSLDVGLTNHADRGTASLAEPSAILVGEYSDQPLVVLIVPGATVGYYRRSEQ